MPLSERERAIATKEAHNIAASEAYFEVRASVVHPQPHTIFDAAFSRGWDAATAPLLAQIAQLEAQLAEARKDAERLENEKSQEEQPRHLWDGSPMPNYRVTGVENTTAETRQTAQKGSQ